MDAATRERLWNFHHAFDRPVTLAITVGLVALLALTPAIIWLLRLTGKSSDKLHGELVQRYVSWIVLVAVILVPVLLGAAWTILGITLLSLFCYHEFAHAAGMHRDRWLDALVYCAILLVDFAALDHWYPFFMALMPLGICAIAALALLPDQPQGYIHRVAVASLGFMLFGCALGHLAYIANDANYRPKLLLLLVAVELNDVFAFISGKLFGRANCSRTPALTKRLAARWGRLCSPRCWS